VSTGKLKTYCKGILYYFQKLIKKLQLVSTGESNEKTKNVVRSFKNTKDSQITHNFFQSVASHESISAQNLNKMMRKVDLKTATTNAAINTWMASSVTVLRAKKLRKHWPGSFKKRKLFKITMLLLTRTLWK
jgi:hypothetical protein